MVSKDLKSSKELEKTENSEIENSEQIIDSETSLSVDSTIEIDEESVKSVEKPLPVDEKVLKKTDEETVDLLIDEPDNVEEEILVSEIVETTVTPEIIEESPSIENSTIEETEKPSVETKEAEIVDSGEPEESDLKATEELAAPIKTKTKKVQKVEIEQELKEEAADLPQDDKKDRIDYSKYTQIELVNALRDLIDTADDNDIKAEVEIIKSVYYKQRNESVELAHATFIEEGGAEEEFVAEEDPYENDIREQLKKFGQLRKEHNRQLDSEKDDNLARKFEIIEKIKGLINNEESINKTFNEFRDLQREWREIGLVPQSKMKNLWDTYHFHVENFYDYIKINRELRDLDLKKNLELKIELCENAEELMVEPSILKAFNTLQKYHEQWREIGPVPRENKDDVWERFKHITSIINKKHQEFFESKKDEQKKNFEAKTALCEKVEEICNAEIESYKDWDTKSKELVELQKIWRTIGFAPKKDNNRIYDRFRTACDAFFNKKRDFYSKNKEVQQNNLQQKIDLCVQAEALMDNTDWKKATQDFINIQKQWKEIGPIPRKHSDIIWKRFRTACDHFFDKKSEHFSDVDSGQIDNLKLKEGLIAELENFKSTGDVSENLKILKDIQRRWTEIGHVPFKKKDALQNKFREEIGKLFDQLNINEDKRNLLKFKTKMSTFSESSRGQSKMRMERDKYMSKLKQLENDLVLLENNIGFFTISKNAKALIEDVNKKIEDTRQKIESLKEKIRVIDEMED
ncbi:MAG TPA: DUF349 domain-containing protein [Bacteroidia bacterium]|nr:DUF349 domain-containing protein [Bacteroidia bacterium]